MEGTEQEGTLEQESGERMEVQRCVKLEIGKLYKDRKFELELLEVEQLCSER